MNAKRDFFISFNKADRETATWIAWVLEEHGYSVFFQDWDFRGNFVAHMDRAHREAERTLAVLSENYFGSGFTLSEWSARFAEDPAGREDRLVPVKVGPLSDAGILKTFVYADIEGCKEDEAEKRLLERVAKAVDPTLRSKPLNRPPLPDSQRGFPQKPEFPKQVMVAVTGDRSSAQVSIVEKIEGQDVSVNMGVQDETVDRLVAGGQNLARKFGIKEGMLIALARRYAQGEANNFDSALAGLERALEVARDERERGSLPSNLSEAVDAVISQIDELNEQGDLDAGQEVLEAELKALDEEDERRKAERVRLYDKGIAQAILTRNARNACRLELAKLNLDTPDAHASRFEALRSIQDAWYARGRDKGLNFDLEVAIELARVNLAHAVDADQRGRAGNNLGNAFSTLGERESGTARLEEAIAAYRAALEEFTRERVPLYWATTQNNLGNALSTLGQRESGTVRLEEAVDAYRAALEEWTRERVPLQWATTQNNLGNALRVLGERESGSARLEEAVAAHRAALEEYTRERVPLDWAMTQNNLGNALRVLGERESGTARLEEAVSAYRAALEERTRERVPLDWAMTQNNLGTALQTLGERESGTVRLEEAVAAHRLALEERTRERVPLQWAKTQNNLGNALWTLGERTSDVQLLQDALEATQNSYDIYIKEAGQTQYEDNFTGRMSTIREKIAELESR